MDGIRGSGGSYTYSVDVEEFTVRLNGRYLQLISNDSMYGSYVARFWEISQDVYGPIDSRVSECYNKKRADMLAEQESILKWGSPKINRRLKEVFLK